MTGNALAAAALLTGCVLAQTADPLQFLPRGTYSTLADSAGNLFAGGSQNGHGFIAKVTPTGDSSLLYVTSGSGSDSISYLAFGPDGSIYATGTTSSTDFPVTVPVGSLPSKDSPRAFVEKLDQTGKVQYATLIGGTNTYGNAIAVNGNGEALVSGQLVDLSLNNFQTTPGAVVGNSDPNTGFLVKLDATGAKTLVAIRGFGLGPVAYDASGNIFVTGAAYGSAEISATPGAFQTSHTVQGCGGTAFVGVACFYQYVAKINADGTRLFYSTLVTGSFGAAPSGLVVDAAGNALIAGSTNSKDYPVTAGAYQTTYRVTAQPPLSLPTPHPVIVPPPSTGYITKLNANGTGLVWSTFFSGTGSETITGFRLDSQNRITITGLSGSRDLPGAQSIPDGCAPVYGRPLHYVAQLNADGTSLIASRYIYGLDPGVGSSIALRPDGTPVIAAGESFKPIDFAASTPLACTMDPADYTLINHPAPGELITLFGDNFGGDGVHVMFNGVPAPLLYSSAQQINTQVPPELAGQDVVTLTVQPADGTALSRPIRLVPRAPSAFLVPQIVNRLNPALECNGFGFSPGYAALISNEDGSVNSCDNPAAGGSAVTFYLNGLGVSTPDVTLTYPGYGAILAVEPEPGLDFGVWRMVFQLPANASSGSIEPLIDGVPLREAFLGIFVRR